MGGNIVTVLKLTLKLLSLNLAVVMILPLIQRKSTTVASETQTHPAAFLANYFLSEMLRRVYSFLHEGFTLAHSSRSCNFILVFK